MGITQARDSVTVLIKSSNQETLELLRGSLPAEHFKVVILEAEASFVEVVRSERPEIAVIDCVDQSPDAAQLEIDVLKSVRPDVRIIALSENPSPNDARIVERGLFYYLANPTASDLLRVIEAAACEM